MTTPSVLRSRLWLVLPLLGAAACGGGSAEVVETGPVGSTVRGDLEYAAATAIMKSFPVQLATTVTMRNRSQRTAEVELGSGCPVLIRAYRDAARTQLAWDQARTMMCTMQIQVVRVEPGDTAQRSQRATAAEILGDSLPDGRYYLGAHVQVTGGLELPAGEADLAVSP